MEKSKEQLEKENANYRKLLQAIRDLVNSKKLPEGFINGYMIGIIDASIRLILEDPENWDCDVSDDLLLRIYRKYEGCPHVSYEQITLSL